MNKREKARQVINILEKEYGNPNTALKYADVFQLLIAVILSAQCTDERVNRVTKELFTILKVPKDFVDVKIETLEKLIFSTGFYRSKAKNIKMCSKDIYEKYNNIVPKSMKDLITLAGVGRKTANVVLSEFYGKAEGVVVDTHIYRVSKRVGLSKSTSPEKVEKDLMKVVDRKDWIKYGNVAIQHGRKVCKSRKPLCNECTIKDICSFYTTLKN